MKLIAQILALYFAFGSLLPGSDFSQLKKAPAVWEHYELHRQLAAGSGENTSVFDFLYAHFLNPGSHQHEDGGQSHQDLPLKTIHTFSQILPVSVPALQLPALPVAHSRVIPHHQSCHGAAHEGAVFRPPVSSSFF
ncbi:MAG: hypothetical protein J5I98_14835 [Phaeodactylibacter sp.]|nr:hypothetical protein [Phaeodactylibacter sp.]